MGGRLKKKNIPRKDLIVLVTLLFIGTSFLPAISGSYHESIIIEDVEDKKQFAFDSSVLDLQYIYNLTENLSNIIFTEYNESKGEIAKGRAFGTKGEHKAAEILHENMSKLGLWTYTEKIGDRRPWHPINLLGYKIEILDYELRINNETKNMTVDCSPLYSNIGPHLRPWKLTHAYSYKGLKLRTNYTNFINENDNYVLLTGAEDPRTNEFSPLDNPNEGNDISGIIDIIKAYLLNLINYYRYVHCKAIIHYDFNDDEHNMWWPQGFRPRFLINGSIGNMINESIDNYKVDIYLKQRFNLLVDSYNVIGQLNGTDSNKTVIVACFYDSWWCQGTADSAIGMAIVLGIAKYFKENNIHPKYNMKFIGFSGEEYGFRGSQYYEANHRDEDIIYVIDLNQLGFTQEYPRLTLEVASNNESFLYEIGEIVNRTDYVNRTGNVTDMKLRYMEHGHLSDDWSFASRRPSSECKTLCFLKNGPWLMHHRDGVNHTEGDVIKYFNWTDVNVTSEMILNVTEYLVLERPYKEDDQETTFRYQPLEKMSNFIRSLGIFRFLLNRWMRSI